MRQVAIAIALAAAVAGSERSHPAPQRDTRGILTDETLPTRYAQREAKAPAAARLRVDIMRNDLSRHNATFDVSYTTAVESNARARAVVRPPPALTQLAAPADNDTAASSFKIDSKPVNQRVRGARQVSGTDVDACAAGASLLLPTTPVKDQGWRCGSCWAFAAVGAYEDAVLARGYREQDLSEQQVLTCSGCVCSPRPVRPCLQRARVSVIARAARFAAVCAGTAAATAAGLRTSGRGSAPLASSMSRLSPTLAKMGRASPQQAAPG